MKTFVAGVGFGGSGYAQQTPELVSFQTTQFLSSFITYLDRPASAKPGDLVVIAFATQTGVFGLQPIPGFTLLASGTGTGLSGSWRIQSRVIDGTEPLIWFVESVGANVDIEAALLHFRNVGSVELGTFNQVDDDEVVGQSMTPSNRGTLYMLYLGNLPGAEVPPTPIGMNLLVNDVIAARTVIWRETRETADSTGDRLTSTAAAHDHVAGLLFATAQQP